MEPIIRNANLSDIDACHTIEFLCFNKEAATRERIRKRILEYSEGFLVMEKNGIILGFINSGAFSGYDLSNERLKDLAGHSPSGRNLVVFSLAVHPSWRGLGYAKLLLNRFIEEAGRLRKRSILLVCREHLIPFYTRFGFEYQGPTACRFGGHHWHEMRLLLAHESGTAVPR